MMSFISKLNGRTTKIHPETPRGDTPRIDMPRIDMPRTDPCAQIYARHKEQGAYEQYRQLLEEANTNKATL